MAAISTPCPSHDILRKLMAGRIDGPEGEQFARHLEECDRCATAVETFQAEDTLVEATRACPTPVDGFEGEQVHGLVDRLIRGGPPPRPSAGGAVAPSLPHPQVAAPQAAQAISSDSWQVPSTLAGSPMASPGQDAGGRFPFLAPPQGSGEIGWLGGFRVVKVLGAGGMGIVFYAEDVQLSRPVALKVMRPEIAADPDARARFLREARAMAALGRTDHVVTIHQVGEANDLPFLTMECLKGMSLEKSLQQYGPLGVGATLRLGIQIARGLAAAHERGLIHRDVKPANLWLKELPGKPGSAAPKYGVKILDFGLALPVQDVRMTLSGTILGTPHYMAPEQARGERVDHRCDLFSLGVVLYRTCTGQLPFRGESATAVLIASATEAPPPVRDLNPAVPPALAELVMQLLAKDPGGRPASAREVEEGLQAIERQLAPPAVKPPVNEERPSSPPARTETSRAIPPVRLGRAGHLLRWRWGVVAMALTVLLPLGYSFSGQIVRIATNQGQVIIEVGDPATEVVVKEAGATIRDRTGQRVITLVAGAHELDVTVTEPSGTTRFFTKRLTLTRGGHAVIDVRQELARATPPAPAVSVAGTPPARPAAPDAGAERRAAEAVLALRGVVLLRRVGQTEIRVEHAANLPAEAFEVGAVNLSGGGVGDAALDALRPLSRLTRLWLAQTAVGDSGLRLVGELTTLTDLQLISDSSTSDAGLAHLRALKNLSVLILNGSRVGDAGLEHLAALPKLRVLKLSGTGVTDAGLAHLPALANLTDLDLGGNTQVTDAGLVHLKALSKLTDLRLYGTSVSDAGLEHLKSLPTLRRLSLNATRVGDAGLVHLRALPNLLELYMSGTQVSDEGVEQLKKALPNLTVTSGKK